MPLQCTRIVRACFLAIDYERNKKSTSDKSGKRFGIGRFTNLIIAIAGINESAAGNRRLSQHSPFAGYVNNFRVFMITSFSCLSWNFVQPSGWLTPIE